MCAQKKCLTLAEQILRGWAGGLVGKSWHEERVIGLSLAESKPSIWEPLFIDKIVNIFIFFFSPSPLPWFDPSSVMKHIAWQFQFIHGKKCFLLWTFKGRLHNGNTVYLPRTLGRKESNTFSLFWSSVWREAAWLILKHEEHLLEKGLWAASIKQNFCLWTVSVGAYISLEVLRKKKHPASP